MAVNGVYAVFRVEAVMNAAGVSQGSAGRSQNRNRKPVHKKTDLFTKFLSDVVSESEEAPEVLQTSVYGRDGRMADVRFRQREYHY